MDFRVANKLYFYNRKCVTKVGLTFTICVKHLVCTTYISLVGSHQFNTKSNMEVVDGDCLP